MVNTNVNERTVIMDVRSSDLGMDFLENGLVRCQACDVEWDGNGQHECTKDTETRSTLIKIIVLTVIGAVIGCVSGSSDNVIGDAVDSTLL